MTHFLEGVLTLCSALCYSVPDSPHGGFFCGLVCGMQIKDVINKYISYCHASNKNARTIHNKKRHLSLLVLWCKENNLQAINDLTVENVFDFINWAQTQCSSDDVWNRVKESLRMMIKYLNEINQFSNFTWSLIKLSKRESESHLAMTYDEFLALSKTYDDLCKDNNKFLVRFRAMHWILWSTGCRRTEILNIPLESLDLINRRLTVKAKKGGGYRICKFWCDPKYINEYLDLWKPEKYLFECCGNTVDDSFQRAKKLSKVRKGLSVHSYRAGLITWLYYEKSVPLRDIQLYIDHKKIDTTAGYIRRSPEEVLSSLDNAFTPEKVIKNQLTFGKRTLSFEARFKKK